MNAKRIEALYNCAIAKLEAKSWEQPRLTSYNDFLAQKEKLKYAPFKAEVLIALIKIATDCLSQHISFNSCLLFDSIRKYYKKKSPAIALTQDFNNKAFNFIQYGFENKNEPAIQCGCKLLKNATLTPQQVKYCMAYALHSSHILNLLLRHKAPDPNISEWVKFYYTNEKFIEHRTKCIGWVLDAHRTYRVGREILIKDFESLLDYDRIVFVNYRNRHCVLKEIPTATEKDESINALLDNENIKKLIDSFNLELVPEKNFRIDIRIDERITEKFRFTHPNYYEYFYNKNGPDFKRIHDTYDQNIEFYRREAMLWGIYYSHMPLSEKAEMLKQFYSHANATTFIKVCKKLKSTELLEWGKENLKGNTQIERLPDSNPSE